MSLLNKRVHRKAQIIEVRHLEHPERALKHLARAGGAFFLDSSSGAYPGFGRYSVLGCRPDSVLAARGRRCERREAGGRAVFEEDPFTALTKWIEEQGTAELDADLPLPSAVGYLGYELNRFIERVREPRPGGLGFPDLHFGFYSSAIVVDHEARRTLVVTTSRGEEPQIRPELLSALEQGEDEEDSPRVSARAAKPSFSLSREAYLRSVERALEHIAAGDIFQVNLSRRCSLLLQAPPLEVYLRLREHNGGPFSAYLDLGNELAVMSTSPERFLRTRGNMVTTNPIKGTRPRIGAPEVDLASARALLRSEKDAAELTMIVDLERNDLGRVCSYGSVEVSCARRLERYPTVFHLVADVGGRLRADVRLDDLLRATFPGGSITGAPKIRAMEIIGDLEPVPREVYTGAIGYIGCDGNLDLNVAIRTVMSNGRQCAFHVGSGIVADSDPIAEYDETEAKGLGIRRALQIPVSRAADA